MKKNLIIIGCGSTAKRVYRFVKMYDLYNVIGFSVDKKYKKNIDNFMGLPIYEIESLHEVTNKYSALIFVAIFWNKLNLDRKNMFLKLKRDGYNFANIISPTAIIRGNITGTNCWINDYSVIQSDANIGNNVYIMDMVLVGNETKIGDHCFLAPTCKIAGGVTIGEQCFIGINSLIFDDTKIGNKCIIGASTSLKRNIYDNTVCKLSTLNNIIKEYSDDEIENKLLVNHNVR